jgi:hypothetical protein
VEEALSRPLREVVGVAVVRSRSGGVTIVLAVPVQVMLRAIIQITESLYRLLGSTGGRFIENCSIYGLAWVHLQERVEDDMRPQRSWQRSNRGVEGGA